MPSDAPALGCACGPHTWRCGLPRLCHAAVYVVLPCRQPVREALSQHPGHPGLPGQVRCVQSIQTNVVKLHGKQCAEDFLAAPGGMPSVSHVRAALCLQPTSMPSPKWTTPTWTAAWPPSTPPCWAACAAQPGCAASAAAASATAAAAAEVACLLEGRCQAGLAPLHLPVHEAALCTSLHFMPHRTSPPAGLPVQGETVLAPGPSLTCKLLLEEYLRCQSGGRGQFNEL